MPADLILLTKCFIIYSHFWKWKIFSLPTVHWQSDLKYLASSGTKHPHEFTHLQGKNSCSGDPPHVQALIRISLLIIANRQRPPPTNQEKIPGPALTYLKVESISWQNERDSLLRARKWGKEDVKMISLVAANRKWVIYDYRVVR